MSVRQLDVTRRQHQPNLGLEHVNFSIEQNAEFDTSQGKRNIFARLSNTAYTVIDHGSGVASDVEVRWYIG